MRTLTLIAVILFAILAIAHQQSAVNAQNFCNGCEAPCQCEGSNFPRCVCPPGPSPSCSGLCQNSPCGGDCYCDHPPEGPLFCTGEGEAKAKLATGKYNITYNHFGKGKAIYLIGQEHRVNGVNWNKKNKLPPVNNKKEEKPYPGGCDSCSGGPCSAYSGCSCVNAYGHIYCKGNDEVKKLLESGEYVLSKNTRWPNGKVGDLVHPKTTDNRIPN